jgi:hypothetical protein
MSSHRSNTNRTPPTEFIKKDLTQQLKVFTPASASASDALQITDVQAIASYSWLKTTTPTIAVPGIFCLHVD